jgi:hypothetical protein
MSAELIETAAVALGPLLPDVVFLGGASIYLWISDPAAPATRATNDVDVISAVAGKAGYYKKCAHRAALLRGSALRGAVDIVGN